MNNKHIFASNLKKYMKINGKTRRDVCEALGFSYYTFSDWVNGKKYPRMDKVEMLANYFGILKSDLIEDKPEAHKEMQKKNDILADIVIELRVDNEFFSLVENLHKLDKEKRRSINSLLTSFFSTTEK